MNWHELQQLTGVGGEVFTVLEETEDLTGKPIEFAEDDRLQSLASVRMARASMPVHTIRFRKSDPVVLAHLIAHECGHVQRMFAAPSDKRVVPVTRPEHAAHAFQALAADPRATWDHMDERYVYELFSIWHQGMVNQTVNLGVDARIESWLYRDHPGLRPNQEKSIALQVQMSLAGLDHKVERVTPDIVFKGGNALNYACLRAVGITMGRTLIRGYEGSPVIDLGNRLAAVLDGPDEGLEGDVRTSNEWAEILGIRGWFDWQPFEDMPASYLDSRST